MGEGRRIYAEVGSESAGATAVRNRQRQWQEKCRQKKASATEAGRRIGQPFGCGFWDTIAATPADDESGSGERKRDGAREIRLADGAEEAQRQHLTAYPQGDLSQAEAGLSVRPAELPYAGRHDRRCGRTRVGGFPLPHDHCCGIGTSGGTSGWRGQIRSTAAPRFTELRFFTLKSYYTIKVFQIQYRFPDMPVKIPLMSFCRKTCFLVLEWAYPWRIRVFFFTVWRHRRGILRKLAPKAGRRRMVG